MITWTSEELNKIEMAEELQLASLQLNGKLCKPVTIWVVRVGDDLYVRSVNGRNSDWFRGTRDRHEGRIRAGGVEKDVTFEDVETDSALNAQIDAEYHAKYHLYPQYIAPLMVPESRDATLKLIP